MTLRKILQPVLSAGVGLCMACAFFAVFLPPLGGSLPRVLAILALLWLGFGLAIHQLLGRLIIPLLKRYTPRARAAWVVICLAAGFFFVAATPLIPETFNYIYPTHRLEISALGRRNAQSAGSEIRIMAFYDNPDVAVSLDRFSHGTDWQMVDGMLTSQAAQPSMVSWSGSMMNRGKLYFYSTPASGSVRVTWDGEAQDLDLYQTANSTTLVKLPVSVPGARYVKLFAPFAYGVSIGFLLLLAGIGLAELRIQPSAREIQKPSWSWALYALPMIAAWGIFLLTFYPGIISSDTTDQWGQFTSWRIVDWAPAIHTLMMWLLTRLWPSPAVVGVTQIALLSLLTAWGLGKLVRLGLPEWTAWLVSGIFALSPVNGSMVITLWKDIPYAISVLALFMMAAWIILSRGRWLAKPGRWIALGVVGAAAALFRQNGLAITVLALAVLLALYWGMRRQLILGAVLFAGAFGLVRGPVYDLARVKRMGTELRDMVLLHHIGAHIEYGTPLTDEEKVYFNALKPLANWQYTCCKVDSLFYQPGFDRALFQANPAKNLRFSIDLALRDPLTELKHMECVSSIVWEVCENCLTLYHWIVPANGQVTWVETNNLGLKEDSRLEGLVRPLANWVWASTSKPAVFWFWGPAFYLYLCLFCVIIYAVRCRSWRYLLIGLVPVVQSLVMIAINIASDFRYQYSVYLIGLFCVALLFLPGQRGQEGLDTENTYI
jgi:hypothetical protein